MLYVFMDNFRGFKETIIPLRDTTFLVGENSTGKSSFLSLLHMLSSPRFWYNPDFSPTDCCDLGSFKDIVSAGSPDQSHFVVGLIGTRPQQKKAVEKSRECAFALMTFTNDKGVPRLSRYVDLMDGKLCKISFFEKNTARYKVLEEETSGPQDIGLIEHFFQLFHDDASDNEGFQTFPLKIPGELPLPIILAYLLSEKEQKMESLHLVSRVPGMINLAWLAPIRTKPRRTYDGFMPSFTPEGAHTPFLIRKGVGRGRKARQFNELLQKFGEASGLFSNVNAHAFARGHAAPFEVLVDLAGEALNISNVGYGVSQVLPVVVEMFTRPKDFWFAIQQPEVHLHPKAQAALGELIHFMGQERGHKYIVETHSDYLIDRFRLRVNKTGLPKKSQVVFFERTDKGNRAYPMIINERGQYPEDQPKEFRDFFIHEEMRLLEI